jgi:hypothetical protein
VHVIALSGADRMPAVKGPQIVTPAGAPLASTMNRLNYDPEYAGARGAVALREEQVRCAGDVEADCGKHP